MAPQSPTILLAHGSHPTPQKLPAANQTRPLAPIALHPRKATNLIPPPNLTPLEVLKQELLSPDPAVDPVQAQLAENLARQAQNLPLEAQSQQRTV